MNLKEFHSKVLAAVNGEPTITPEEASAIYAETMVKLDPNKVKWAIEDESEREEWQHLVVLTAAARYMEAKEEV